MLQSSLLKYSTAGLLLLTLLVWTGSQSASAQSPFISCAEATSGNATVIIPDTADLFVDGNALKAGDQLAIVAPDGQCAGRLVWSGESAALIAWEAGLFSETPAGLRSGDPLTLHVWQHKTKRLLTPKNSEMELTLDTSAPHLNDTLHYQRNGIYVVKQLSIRSPHNDKASR